MKVRIVREGEWRVLAVCSERGDCELLEFLDGLEGRQAKDRDRLLGLLERVAQAGVPRNTEVSHKLAGGVWEFIQGDLRVLYFRDVGRVVICSHGFLKRGQKAPKPEIARAQMRCDQYMASRVAGTLEVIGD